MIILGDEKKAKRGNTRARMKRRQDRGYVQNIAYGACVDSQKSSRMSRAWPNALDNLRQHLKQKKCRAVPLDNFELVQICLDSARQGSTTLDKVAKRSRHLIRQNVERCRVKCRERLAGALNKSKFAANDQIY